MLEWVSIVVQELLGKIRRVRVSDYSRSRMTQQITSCNLRHDDSAELMFIVYVMI